MCVLFPSRMKEQSGADHGMVQPVFNNFEIADMDLWRGEAYTAFFNYLDHNGGFYYQVYPLPLIAHMNREDPTEISCMNSVGVTRPSTRSGHRYSGAKTGCTSSGRSDTNITRLYIVPRVRCGSVGGVLATRSETSVCDRLTGLCRRSFVDVFVSRLSWGVVLLAEVGAGD